MQYDKSNIKLKEHIELITILASSNNESVIKKSDDELIVAGDSIDIAFKILSLKMKTDDVVLNQIATILYESEQKYSALKYEKENQDFLTIKGSVEVVLSHCNTMLIDGHEQVLDKKAIEKHI